METISTFLTADHRICDELFARLETSVVKKDWSIAKTNFEDFSRDLIHHFDMEEKVFFPIFEENTGMSCGPTQVMKMEHEQMRFILNQLENDLKKEDDKHFLGLSETLMMLMQQHNMKEEQMLYKMADMHLGSMVQKIIEDMRAL